MESSQFSLLSGPDLQSFGADHGAFGDVGAGLIDTGDLPNPDPFRLRLFSFITRGDGNDSFTFFRGGTGTVYFGDGTSSSSLNNVSQTYTSFPSGSAISVTTDAIFTGGIDAGGSASDAIKKLDGLTFYWDAITGGSGTLKLENLGIKQPMPKWNNGNNVDYITVNFKGNSIPGGFPSNVTAKNMFIQSNKFNGELPSLSSTTKKYQVQGNAFEGGIHDLSANTVIESYLAYGQDDGQTYSRVYPKVMLTGEIPNLSGATALTFYHVGAGEPWNRGFKNDLSLASDFDVTNKLSRFYASNCQLSTVEVDKILNAFANAGTTSPNIIDISGSNGYPTSAGLADKDTLVAAGWTVNLPALN